MDRYSFTLAMKDLSQDSGTTLALSLKQLRNSMHQLYLVNMLVIDILCFTFGTKQNKNLLLQEFFSLPLSSSIFSCAPQSMHLITTETGGLFSWRHTKQLLLSRNVFELSPCGSTTDTKWVSAHDRIPSCSLGKPEITWVGYSVCKNGRFFYSWEKH